MPATCAKVIERRVSVERLTCLQTVICGKTFEVNCVRYQITEVYRDDLNRAIAVGTLCEQKEMSA